MLRRLLFASFLLVSAVGLAGCGPDFEPYWSVDKYRILGVQADPVTLHPGEVAELTILDHIPPERSVTYEWSWCPVEPSAQEHYTCPLEELAERQQADAGMAPDAGGGPGLGIAFDPSYLELGDGPTAQLPYFGDEQQILELCRGIQEAIEGVGEQSGLSGSLQSADCTRGYDISVMVEAQTDEGRIQVAKKDLTLWTGGETNNENPVHNGFSIRVAKASDVPKVRDRLDWVPPPAEDRDREWYKISLKESVPVLKGISYDLRAHVGERSVEEYRPPVPEGSDRERMPLEREALTFRWFVSSGSLDDTQSVYAPGTNQLRGVRRTVWTVDELPGPGCAAGPDGESVAGSCETSVYSVVRDGRLGLGYAKADFQVVGMVGGKGGSDEQ